MHVSLIFTKIISPIFVFAMHLLLLPQHMFSNMFAASKDYVKCLMLIFQKVIYPIFCFCNTFAACFSDTFATSKDYAMCVPVILKIISLIFCFCDLFAASSPTYVLATRLPLQKIMQHVCHSS